VKRALDGVIAALARWPGERVDLLVGEPCFDPPAAIQKRFGRIAGDPAPGYGPPGGLSELRAVLAGRLDPDRADPRRVMVTHGAKGGLLALLAALVEPGDEVIHPLPCYPAYPAMVSRLGGVPMGVAEHGDGFAGWSASVLAIAGPRTRAVVLSSPSNPSGTTIAARELTALVDGCCDRGIRLILDEAYSAFCFGGDAVDSAVVDAGYVLARVGSASKSLALPGWRMGWIVADEELVSRVTSVQSALLNPPATPPQRAMLALPEVPDSYFEVNRRVVSERLEAMVGAVRRAGFDAVMPAGGFYLWVDIRDRLDVEKPDSATWCVRLAEANGVGLWPGEDFGTPGFVRLALPQGNAWREALAELERRLTAAR
jgi:aspartate/methionine/tyrosine aminotransferase